MLGLLRKDGIKDNSNHRNSSNRGKIRGFGAMTINERIYETRYDGNILCAEGGRLYAEIPNAIILKFLTTKESCGIATFHIQSTNPHDTTVKYP